MGEIKFRRFWGALAGLEKSRGRVYPGLRRFLRLQPGLLQGGLSALGQMREN